MTHEYPQQPSTRTSTEDDAQLSGGGRSIGMSLETIMELTGLTREEIRRGFRADPPQTLAGQALAEGVSQDELVDAVVAAIQLRVPEAVAAGRITQGQADERLADLEVKITDMVTTIPFRRGGHRVSVDNTRDSRLTVS